jgi:nucleoside-diphosphate-sugar epimerase
MGKTVVLGCGYTGLRLAKALREQGHPVTATTTRSERLDALAGVGVDPVVLDFGRPETVAAALAGARRIIHLAPPTPGRVEAEVELLRQAAPDLEVLVYGSTTGAFGEQAGDQWVDEVSPPGPLGARGQLRADYERALLQAGLPTKVVRIAGIYGPGRTLREGLRDRSLLLFEGGPPTSRIHVDDLVRLLSAMNDPGAPALVIGCDERPATTLEVARYTAGLLNLELPTPLSLEEARRTLSPAALEMRLGGRRCRSLVRPNLIGPLRYPSYVEGVPASFD